MSSQKAVESKNWYFSLHPSVARKKNLIHIEKENEPEFLAKYLAHTISST